ncbi:hypothetical protein [Phreatobacter sp.]|uniref:hypothetical protein n=1 Tax=Phreatobacter sp. TaxID=1966341 RepID=UPI0022BD5133|nr:hypothetical protein [Phreatobacter sp.]MCZ8313896.1 hypothetical protein [Phreatobacter sp.]
MSTTFRKLAAAGGLALVLSGAFTGLAQAQSGAGGGGGGGGGGAGDGGNVSIGSEASPINAVLPAPSRARGGQVTGRSQDCYAPARASTVCDERARR